ncbi:MAG: hypothetical protein PHH98_03370 [Candidatus Gracilibacteria bacterium]|nr:hypothetical protein [Candidatus Gracilibacteria bacterium]
MNEKINSGVLNEKERLDKKIMLDNLANEISKKFKIEKKEILSLIKNTTLEGLENLKSEIKETGSSDLNKLDNSELEKLFLILKGAQELIENSSKLEIKILKDDVEKSISIDDFKNHIEDYLPSKLIDKAKNPTALHEHILGFALGTANSLIATIDLLYQIGAGIIKMPYHIYMIVSGKGEIKSMKNI